MTSRGRLMVSMINKKVEGVPENNECQKNNRNSKQSQILSNSDIIYSNSIELQTDSLLSDNLMQNIELEEAHSEENLKDYYCRLSESILECETLEHESVNEAEDTSYYNLITICNNDHVTSGQFIENASSECIPDKQLESSTKTCHKDFSEDELDLFKGQEERLKKLFGEDILNPPTEINCNNLCEEQLQIEPVNSSLVSTNEADWEHVLNSDDDILDPDYQPDDVSCTFDHDISTVEPNSRGRPKKGRKRKYKHLREERKKLKYSNKEYTNMKNEIIKPKTFKQHYDCLCREKCSQKITEEERLCEFNKFYELGSYNSQTLYILSMINETEKKRNTTQNSNQKRKFSRKYKLGAATVCQKMFLETLQISSKRVTTSLNKQRSDHLIDLRGNNCGGKNKISDEQLENIKNHINKIPKYVSHYRRNDTSALFLPSNMTIIKMYNLYTEEYANPVSFAKYKQVYYSEFNLRRKPLKKDTCNTCDTLKVKLSNTENDNEKEQIKKEREQHWEFQQKARDLMKKDFQDSKNDSTLETLTYDLERTLPLPRIPTNIVFYKRQLWLYNAGIHSATTEKAFCYPWLEGEAGRGAQEIGSVLIKHIRLQVNQSVCNLILWSDSCGGQNRNIKIILLLKAFLSSQDNIQKIYFRYLVPGHTFLPNDSDFGDIECALKLQQRIYTPQEYINVFKSCRQKNPIEVTVMEKEDFYSSHTLEKNIQNRKKDIAGNKLNWLKIREIMITKEEPTKIYFKETFDSEDYRCLDIKKNIRTRSTSATIFPLQDLPLLWPQGKAVSNLKLADLKSLMHFIPEDAKHFYESLRSEDSIVDDIDGFNAGIDFELQEE